MVAVRSSSSHFCSCIGWLITVVFYCVSIRLPLSVKGNLLSVLFCQILYSLLIRVSLSIAVFPTSECPAGQFVTVSCQVLGFIVFMMAACCGSCDSSTCACRLVGIVDNVVFDWAPFSVEINNSIVCLILRVIDCAFIFPCCRSVFI